ncbi:GNAT family N-acetyltransferase [uncultured Oxalicibacterium sp.]|uniref:GNAT family N-acetyltransferase n=1 Tax=uncultured Oxalicibacterium sp. TaxID=1168540 RepID=UPI0025E9A88D|nr:GNAT family N-acetyltransferase [uncultured Oxalicibacterium sp.]
MYTPGQALPLRLANEDDLDRIIMLETLGFAAGICESREVMQHRLRHFPQGFLILADDRNQAVGYLSSELWSAKVPTNATPFTLGHDIRDTHDSSGSQLYISSMTIHPAYRGGGVGRAFFQQCVARLCRDLSQVRSSILLVSAEWLGAHHIYATCGYEEIMRLGDFFSAVAKQNADAIVMRKVIT